MTTPESPAAAAIGRALRQQDDQPGTAPTQEGATRVRAMVEIAKELGAQAPSASGRMAISGPVTQEMLDVAEQAYVDAVQRAWEGHGFPWTDSSVLRTLGELEALVGALESIMQTTVRGDTGSAGARVATDFNRDGFVDINDLWDAHIR